MLNNITYEFFNNMFASMEKQNASLKEIIYILSKNKKEESEDWIRLGMDDSGNFLPPGVEYENYEWVLVKIRDDTNRTLSVPRIAKYDSIKNVWISVDSCNCTYKVVMWKPIPGTEYVELSCSDGSNCERIYQYN